MSIEVMVKSFKEEVRVMDTRQKIGVGVVFGITALRLAALAPLLAKPSRESWTLRDTVIAGVIPLSDFLDGVVARKIGAETTVGGYVDQTLDKLTMTALELKLASRGDIHIAEVASRINRDIRVNNVRNQVMKDTEGNVSVNANSHGKRSTALRMAANILSTSPIAAKMPMMSRLVQANATKSLIESGEYNIAAYTDAREKYENTLA
jgi:phosphatidylglycerophosphate synthase